METSLESLSASQLSVFPSEQFSELATINTTDYHERAFADRLGFWADRAKELLWRKPWTHILRWAKPHATWFEGGQLNACENCIDVHLSGEIATKTALIWEGEMGEVRRLTYAELSVAVNRLANVFRHQLGVNKGDRISLYMPLIPELMIAVLACARVGAIHSVVFGGFSATSLRDRILDSGSKVVMTADGGYRRGVVLNLKETVDQALQGGDTPVEHVVVVKHLGQETAWVEGRDVDYAAAVAAQPSDCPAETMESEDPLFILYTSGTTGKPKGILHTTGGYLTHAKYSTRVVFDLKPQDVYWCTADIGWITGHTYVVYGPLANGATVFMYEGAPDYPDRDRFWALIAKHGVTIFYTAPTAIRAFMKWGDSLPAKHDLSSLRLLGSVGEPINPEAWDWYHAHIGRGTCPIVDTWWQTETGGIMVTTLPGLDEMRPGYAGKPLPGIVADVVTEAGVSVGKGAGLLTLTEPWPSMLRGIWGDPDRYQEVYWSNLPTYFCGDGATLTEDGYIMVLGRMDDVLNVAGHRIGTMEVESALVECEGVAEAAVVGIPDEIKGQAILAFVILKESMIPSPELGRQLITHVAQSIGAIAKPKRIVFTPELPKTRSGKIMRRILKELAVGNPVGDVTTLANPACVVELERLIPPTPLVEGGL